MEYGQSEPINGFGIAVYLIYRLFRLKCLEWVNFKKLISAPGSFFTGISIGPKADFRTEIY